MSSDKIIFNKTKFDINLDNAFNKININKIKLDNYNDTYSISYNNIIKGPIKIFEGDYNIKIKYKNIIYELIFFKDYYGIKYNKRNSKIELKLHKLLSSLYNLNDIIIITEKYLFANNFVYYKSNTLFQLYYDNYKQIDELCYSFPDDRDSYKVERSKK